MRARINGMTEQKTVCLAERADLQLLDDSFLVGSAHRVEARHVHRGKLHIMALCGCGGGQDIRMQSLGRLQHVQGTVGSWGYMKETKKKGTESEYVNAFIDGCLTYQWEVDWLLGRTRHRLPQGRFS